MGDVNVLLVEDQAGDAVLIRHHLRSPVTTGFMGEVDLDHVESLTAGFDALERAPYDVVLLDLGLPESTGLATLARLLDHAPEVPVVVLTGNTDDRLAVDAVRAGAQDYLTKGTVDDHSLGRALRYAIEREKQERELRRQNERLEEFASVVSHDLRNPLNVAIGRLDLAMRDCDSAHLDAVSSAHYRMAALVDDVLTLARQGETISDPRPVSLGAVVRAAAENTVLDGVDLVVADLPTVEGDRERLSTVFENLFRNAVEHGAPADELTVRVGALAERSGFYVEDDGPGIPDEERGRVFESGFSTAASGTGFGLAIVRRIVEAHGWTVAATASTDGGARFEVTTERPAGGRNEEPAVAND